MKAFMTAYLTYFLLGLTLSVTSCRESGCSADVSQFSYAFVPQSEIDADLSELQTKIYAPVAEAPPGGATECYVETSQESSFRVFPYSQKALIPFRVTVLKEHLRPYCDSVIYSSECDVLIITTDRRSFRRIDSLMSRSEWSAVRQSGSSDSN